jgi:hypothetical protein
MKALLQLNTDHMAISPVETLLPTIVVRKVKVSLRSSKFAPSLYNAYARVIQVSV